MHLTAPVPLCLLENHTVQPKTFVLVGVGGFKTQLAPEENGLEQVAHLLSLVSTSMVMSLSSES